MDDGVDPQHPTATAIPTKLPLPWVGIALIVANVIVFGIATAAGANPLLPTPAKMIDLGGNLAQLTLGGEPWRLVTSMFLHYGILHLAMNMIGLWSGAALAEQMHGRAGFLALYLVAGLAGGIASIATHDATVSAGASGAIFGIFGGIGAFLLAHRDRIDPTALKKQVKGLVVFMAYNLLYGVTQKQIDMSAHLGGLGAGFVFGLALEWRRALPARSTLRVVAATVVGLGLCVAAVAALPQPGGVFTNEDTRKLYIRFDEVSAKALERYNGLVVDVQADKVDDATFAAALEKDVLPPWRELTAAFDAVKRSELPPRVVPGHNAMVAYLHGQLDAWEMFRAVLRGEPGVTIEAMQAKQQAAEQRAAAVQAELGKLQ